MRLWKNSFPLLKIRPPSEDICLQCHVFKNQFKCTFKKRYDPNNSDDDNSIDHSNTMIQDRNNVYGTKDLEDNIIIQAAVHVKHARNNVDLIKVVI